MVVNWRRKRELSAMKGDVCSVTFVIVDVITSSLIAATVT